MAYYRINDISISGNTIQNVNTNGNIVLLPNGTGIVDTTTLQFDQLSLNNLSSATGVGNNDIFIVVSNPTGTSDTLKITGTTLRSSLLNQPAQLQFRQGLESERLLVTPATGEPIWITDTKRLFIGDGSTVGGIGVSMSGHTHLTSDITNFNSGVSGLITGSGNYISRFNSSGSGITSSVIYQSGNNIGIGTTAPPHLLTVSGASTTAISIQTPWAVNQYGQFRFDTSVGSASLRSYIPGDSTNGLQVFTYGAGSETAKMTILGGGNVGIATTTPSGQLHVIGSGIFSTGIIVGDGTATSPSIAFNTWRNTGFSAPGSGILEFTVNGSKGMRLSQYNTLGINLGTASALGFLHVRGNGSNPAATTDPLILESSVGSGAIVRFKDSASNDWSMGLNPNGSIRAGTGSGNFAITKIVSNTGIAYVTVDTSGNLGIGTVSPSGKLHVIGSGIISSTGTVAPNALLSVYSSISGDNVFNVEGTNGSLFSVVDNLSGSLMSVNNNAGLPVFEVFSDDRIVGGRFGQNDWVVSSGGNIGIGTGVPTFKLHVIGTGNFSQNLLVNGTGVSISGHTHISSNITNFNSAVSGLLPTIANSGDNRILTSIGSTVGINAETNATFDGTNFNISGILNVDNLRIDGNTISSTNNNGNIIISPTGNGALQVSSGGNSRGTNAIDLQKERFDINSAVAGGQYSNILGGLANAVSNNSTSSSILGGTYNTIFNSYCATIGNNNSSAGQYSLNFGNSNICFKPSNFAIGAYNTVSAPNSTAIGNYNFIGAPSGYIEYYVLSVDSNIIYLEGSYGSAFASGTPITIYGYYKDFVNYTVNSVSENSDNTITALVVNSGVSPLYEDGDTVRKNNTSSIGSFSTAIGSSASCTHRGELAFANGTFISPGEAQHSTLIAKITTTTNTANTVLTLDGASVASTNRLTIQPRTAWTFNIKLSAYNITDNQSGWWIFRGGIRRNAANSTVLVGSIITENGVESSLSTASASVVADDTNEALEIRVTGVSGKEIRWVAVVELTQCGTF
jgi:hypothetical protein